MKKVFFFKEHFKWQFFSFCNRAPGPGHGQYTRVSTLHLSSLHLLVCDGNESPWHACPSIKCAFTSGGMSRILKKLWNLLLKQRRYNTDSTDFIKPHNKLCCSFFLSKQKVLRLLQNCNSTSGCKSTFASQPRFMVPFIGWGEVQIPRQIPCNVRYFMAPLSLPVYFQLYSLSTLYELPSFHPSFLPACLPASLSSHSPFSVLSHLPRRKMPRAFTPRSIHSARSQSRFGEFAD